MCIFQAFILGFSGAYIQLHPSFLLGCGLEGWDNRMHSPRIALICSIELFLLALLLIKVAFLYPSSNFCKRMLPRHQSIPCS